MSCDLECVCEAMMRCMLPVQPNLEVIKAHGVLSKRWPTSARKIFINKYIEAQIKTFPTHGERPLD